MTIIGSILLPNKKAFTFSDSKISGGYSYENNPQKKILHFGNISVAGTGYLRYFQLFNLYLNSDSFINKASMFNKTIKQRIKQNKYEWDDEILFILFNEFFDWINNRGWNFSSNNDEIISTCSFLITTPTNIYSVVWGSIETLKGYANLGSGAMIANTIYDTLMLNNNNNINIYNYLTSIINIVPKSVKGVEKPFYLSIVENCKPKKSFYTLEKNDSKIVMIENEEEIKEFLKKNKLY